MFPSNTSYIEDLIKHGHYAKIVTMNADEMMDVFKEQERICVGSNSKNTPNHESTPTFAGERQECFEHIIKNGANMDMFVSSSSVVKNAFHFDSRTAGNFSLNNRYLCIGFMFLADKESLKTCSTFIKFIKKSIAELLVDKPFIMDQHRCEGGGSVGRNWHYNCV